MKDNWVFNKYFIAIKHNDSDEKVAIDCFESLGVLSGEGMLAMDRAA